ncbi:transcription regulator HTH, apses-type DNA-binding domain-containing protein [Fimicolochytrium jonesii]|uniref:transcription regulator HTH, apses-type DNA-binding domain-containing protein n=1 Tax=Fimicolochytrium jonesii TaxID=1396493 RepID=UPI0022FEE526|nr:transcription regulator HTH, apses-type DNA-binding domain-containing protein [Fimicolochytrium jonesii]KAI8819609.1 transcription regulator HTH, apses-type DNA-binding domain-containing protein [Fimicolochytrium jonesii]
MYGDVVKDQRGAAATLKSEDIIAPAAEYTFPHQPLIDAPTAAAKKPKRRYSRSTPATDLAIPFSGSIPLRDPCFPSAPGLTIASWNGVPVYQMACTRVVSVPVALPMPASANDTTTDTPTPPSTSPPQVPQTTTTTRTTTQVMRRQSDGWVNATHILKAAGVARATRLRVLERDLHNGPHEKVQGGYGKYQGTWVPVEIAHRLAEQNGILETLLPLLRAGGTDPTVGHGPVAAKTTPQPPTINVIAPSASTTPTSPTGRGDGLAVAGGV